MRIRVLLTLLLIGFTFASLHARCVRGDCRDGAGEALLSNGDRYAGQWRSGQMHGQGTYRYRSGAVYTGAFRGGKLEGRGTMRYPDGAYYEGDWRGNRKHGQGRLVRPSGKTQRGRWADGKFVGGGSPNVAAKPPSRKPTSKPARPAATEESGLRDCNRVFCGGGRGRYAYRDGAVYVGEFEEGSPSGEGEVRYASGDVYTGGWDANAPDGLGTYVFASGRQVSGRWRAGKLIERQYREPAAPSTPPARRSSARPGSDRRADGQTRMYAVVVGVGAYDAMQTLRFTDDDAYQVYAFLKSPEGGALPDDDVEVLIDERATRANIERALADKLARADADDIVVFYFSGHGVDGYFVPVDFDGANNLLSHRRVQELLDSSAAKHKLVLADACYSGGLLASKAGRGAAASAERLYAAFAEARGGTALLLSSKSTEVSLEAQNLRSGVFSHFLLRGLKGEADRDRDRVVTVAELHRYLFAEVRGYTGRRQTPVLTGDYDADMPVAVLR